MPLNLIPQIFYDLIARIIPGSIFLILIYPAFNGLNSALNAILKYSGKDGILNIWSFFVFMIFSYITGFILGQLVALTLAKIKKRTREENKQKTLKSCLVENNNTRKIFNQDDIKLDVKQLPSIYDMYDHIRFFSPAEAYRILKLMAETRMCEILSLSFFILLVTNIIFWLFETHFLIPDRIIFLFIMLIGIIIFWRTANTLEFLYVNSTCRLWLFYNFPFESLKAAISERIKSHSF